MSWFVHFALVVVGGLAPCGELLTVAPRRALQDRFTEAEQILAAIRDMYDGLHDVSYEFDQWTHYASKAQTSTSGKVVIRLDDGALLVDVRGVHSQGVLWHEVRSFLRGEDRMFHTRGNNRTFHVQPRRAVGTLGYGVALLPIIAARDPERYVVEFIGRERVGLTRCIRLAIYDGDALGSVLANYAERVRRGEPAEAPPTYHLWLTLDGGLKLHKWALVAQYGVPSRRKERAAMTWWPRKQQGITWAEGRPKLWLPLEIECECNIGRGGRAAGLNFEQRRVIIPDSIRVNSGVTDETFALKPPAGVPVSRPGPPLKDDDVRGVLLAPPIGSVQGPVEDEVTEEGDVDEILKQAGAGTPRRWGFFGWKSWLMLMAGTVLFAIALWLRLRQS